MMEEIIYQVLGWTSLVLLTFRYYPQLYENYKKKSVSGLTHEFVAFSILDHGYYIAISVIFIAFGLRRVNDYEGYNFLAPLDILDMILVGHALFVVSLVYLQIMFYGLFEEYENYVSTFFYDEYLRIYHGKDYQKIKYKGIVKVVFFATFFVFLTLTIGVGICIEIYDWNTPWYPDLLIAVGACITIMRYIPQLYWNYVRETTYGWNTLGVFLDLGYGLMLLVQFVFLIVAKQSVSDLETDTWIGLVVGFLVTCCNLFFLFQRFYLYNNKDNNVLMYEV